MDAAEDEPFQHNVAHVAAIVFSFLIAVVQLIFGFFSYAGYGFFSNTLVDLNTLYETEAYPSISLPIVGLIVYALQIPWTVYNITTIWREGINDYLYVRPSALSIIVNISFIINSALTIAWFFLWDRKMLIPEVAVLLAGSIFAAVSLGAAVYIFYLRVGELEKMGKTADIFMNRFLVHNGLSAFAAYFFLFTCLQASVVATHGGSMSDHDASTMAIGLMAFCVLLTIAVHDFILDKYFHYTFANYAVWVALIVPIIVDFDAENRNHILALVLLLVIAIFLIIKLYRFCCGLRDNYDDDVEVTETAVGIHGQINPVVIQTKSVAIDVKPKKMKKVKKVKKVFIDQDIDGEINLSAPCQYNRPQATGNYRIIQTPAPCEMFTSDTTPAYQQIEVLNVPRTRPVPAFTAQQNDDPYHIVPQEAQLYYNPGSSARHHAPPPPSNQSVYNSGPVTIEPVMNPNMLSMNSLKNLSGTPMGIMSLPKSAIPQPQPPPTCASTYGTCGGNMNQYESCGNVQQHRQPSCGGNVQQNRQPSCGGNVQQNRQPSCGGNVQQNQQPSCGGNVHLNAQMSAPAPCHCQGRY